MTDPKAASDDKIERDAFFNDLMTAYHELGEWARGERVAQVTQFVHDETVTRTKTATESPALYGRLAAGPSDPPFMGGLEPRP